MRSSEDALWINFTKKYNIMGVFGDIIRTMQDTIEGTIEACGGDAIKEELEDIVDAIKGHRI